MKTPGSSNVRRLRSVETLRSNESQSERFSVRELISQDVRTVLADFEAGAYADGNRESHMVYLLELALLFPEARRFVVERKDQFIALMDEWEPARDEIATLFAQVFPEEKKKYQKKIIEAYQELAEYTAKRFHTQPRVVYSASVLFLLCVYAPENREEWKRSYQSSFDKDLGEIETSGNERRFDLLLRAAVFCLVFPELKGRMQQAFPGMPRNFRQQITQRLYTHIGSALDMEIVFGETFGALDEQGMLQQSGGRLRTQQPLPDRLTA